MPRITNGDRVKFGRKGADGYCTGVVQSVDAGTARVAWDDGSVTEIAARDLRRTSERYSGGHRIS